MPKSSTITITRNNSNMKATIVIYNKITFLIIATILLLSQIHECKNNQCDSQKNIYHIDTLFKRKDVDYCKENSSYLIAPNISRKISTHTASSSNTKVTVDTQNVTRTRNN